ncbi:DUF6157 family protein [Paenibacillus sp. JCM 10914]|uniref:DUF6157 family protein n=1 Tax=Paenibacillus sp. JCM 10914 TaxID=1236974 RepID=UPI0003CC961D|nr:DUF6157 family protein [Paenibacillus sp. JCM 10914]GAE06816.1 hypothetical protein JCM10914_2997 [Paenibacillus sp. JCM 10914]
MKDMNYYDTFIEVSEDCPVEAAEVPQTKNGKQTVPVLQYEMIARHPYRYTQEEILFEIFAQRNDITEEQRQVERTKFFSKGQPCLRTSSLGKRYGWGMHHDAEGKVALYAVESDEYQEMKQDQRLKHVKAMRSGRK